MQIIMTTFAGRKVHYIHETLQSLFASDWRESNGLVYLIMGSEDESHVMQYATHPAIRILPWDTRTSDNLRWNCTLNKIRALRCGDDAATLICEDDILFSADWLSALRRATATLEDENYVLSLFADPAEIENACLVEGQRWVKHYPTPDLQGAQALYYPTRGLRDNVATYLAENLTLGSGDELIGRYAREFAALYVTGEPLVANVGAVSCFARSPNE